MFTRKYISSTERQNLSDLFDKADALLKNTIDPLVENFKITDTTFYNRYWTARVIHDLGLGHEEKTTTGTTTNTTTPTV